MEKFLDAVEAANTLEALNVVFYQVWHGPEGDGLTQEEVAYIGQYAALKYRLLEGSL